MPSAQVVFGGLVGQGDDGVSGPALLADAPQPALPVEIRFSPPVALCGAAFVTKSGALWTRLLRCVAPTSSSADDDELALKQQEAQAPPFPGPPASSVDIFALDIVHGSAASTFTRVATCVLPSSDSRTKGADTASDALEFEWIASEEFIMATSVVICGLRTPAAIVLLGNPESAPSHPPLQNQSQRPLMHKQHEGNAEIPERQGGDELDPVAELRTTTWHSSSTLLSHRPKTTGISCDIQDLLSDSQQMQLQAAAKLYRERKSHEDALQYVVPVLGAIWHRLEDNEEGSSLDTLNVDHDDDGSSTTSISVKEWELLSELAANSINDPELEDDTLYYALLLSTMGLSMAESRDVFALVFGHAGVTSKLIDLFAPQNTRDVCTSQTDAQLCSEDNPVTHPGVARFAARTLSLLASSPYAYASFLKENCIDRVVMTLPWSAKARPAISRTIARTIYYLSVSSAVKAIGDVYKESTTSPGTEDKADELARIAQAIHSLALVLSNEDLPHDFSCSRESGWDRWVLDLNLAQAVESPHKKTTLQRHDRVSEILRYSRVFTRVSFFAAHALKHDLVSASPPSPLKWPALHVLESVALLWDTVAKGSVVGMLVMTSDEATCKSLFAAYCHWNWRVRRIDLLVNKAMASQAAEILMGVWCTKLVASRNEESVLDILRTIKQLSAYSEAVPILVFPPCLEKLFKLMLCSSSDGLRRLSEPDEPDEQSDSLRGKEIVLLCLHILNSIVRSPDGVAGLIDQWSTTDARAILAKCHEFLISGGDSLHDEGYTWVELMASVVGIADTATCLAGGDGLALFARRLENDVDAVVAEGVGLRRRWQTAALISAASKLRCLCATLQSGPLVWRRALIGRLSGPLLYCERLLKVAAASASLPGSLPLNEAVLAAECASRAVCAILQPFTSWAGGAQPSDDDKRGWRRQTLEAAIVQLHERIVRESMEGNARFPVRTSAITASLKCLGRAVQALSAAAAPDYYCWEGPMGALATDPLESTTTLISRATLLTDAIDAFYASQGDSPESLNDIRNWLAFGITTEGGVLELVEHLAWSGSKLLRRTGIALAVRLASVSRAAPEALLPTLYQLCERGDSLMAPSPPTPAADGPAEKDERDSAQMTSGNFDEAETDQSRVARLLVFLHSLLVYGPVRAAMAATNLPAYISRILDFFPPDSPHLFWIARVIWRFLDPGPRSSSIGATDVAVSHLPRSIATDGFIMLLSLFDSSSAPAILAALHATGEYVAGGGQSVISDLLSQSPEQAELPSLNGRLEHLAERLEVSPKERTLSTEAALISKQLVGIASKNSTGAELVKAIVSVSALEKLSSLLVHRPTERESMEEAIQALMSTPAESGAVPMEEPKPLSEDKEALEWEFPKSSIELLYSFAVAEESARTNEALEEGVEDAALFEFGEWSLTGASVDDEARPALALPSRGVSNFRLRRNTPGRKASMHVDDYQSGSGGGGGVPTSGFWMM